MRCHLGAHGWLRGLHRGLPCRATQRGIAGGTGGHVHALLGQLAGSSLAHGCRGDLPANADEDLINGGNRQALLQALGAGFIRRMRLRSSSRSQALDKVAKADALTSGASIAAKSFFWI